MPNSLAALNNNSQVHLNLQGLTVLYAGSMSIGARIRQLRIANGLSGTQFGEMCGVTKGMVSQWESDMLVPSTGCLMELRKSIVFSHDWLIYGDGVYSTSDPKIICALKAMEPTKEHVKDAAVQAVLTTCELAKHYGAKK